MIARPTLCALVVLAAGCTDGGEAPAPPDAPRPVRTAPVVAEATVSSVHAVGVLAPANEARLAFKVGGVLARIDVDEGDAVRAGDVLAVLDQTQIDAAVARAAQAADKAARDLARAEALYADDVATLEQVQDLTTAAEVARADLAAARFDARYARIVAPADGVVLRRLADPNELVAAGAPVLVVGDTTGGWVVNASVADRDAVRLAPGDAARVTFDAFPGATFDARVSRVATASDPATGTYAVELAIAEPAPRFAQGLVAKVELTFASQPAARLWVPITALLEAEDDAAEVFVLAADGARVARRAVRIGELAGDRVAVLAGLAAGDHVVVEGAAWLEDGAGVTVLAQAE
jgi:membrane fusion protein, multidrug efflux system